MARGTITRLAERGYGFIERGARTDPFFARKDLFFRSTVLDGVTFDALHEGDLVEFETEVGTLGRGDLATRVRRVS